MIIVVGGIKGGSGKTTVATNLAVIRSKDGREPTRLLLGEGRATWALFFPMPIRSPLALFD